MATEKDLMNAVKESMEANGQLAIMKAKMQTEIMKLLDGSDKSKNSKCPKLTYDILILNELIREYIEWMGYLYTNTVFTTESNLGKQPLDRSFILQDLKIKDAEETKSLPLLFNLLETFRKMDLSNPK